MFHDVLDSILLQISHDRCVPLATNFSIGSYAGSKRATELMADTLRLELAPFNVKVLCVVTGAVSTLGQTYFGGLKLPEDSLYKPIEETVVSRAQGHDGTERMPLMEYSSQVVAQIEQGATGRFWCGNNSDSAKAGISGESNDMMVSRSTQYFEIDVRDAKY